MSQDNMNKNNIDVSSDLGSLLNELSEVRKQEEKKKQEKLKEINKDSSFASMMAELSQVAKETKVIKKEEKEVTTKEEKVGLLSQLSQLAKETKKEESYEIGKDYADHTKEVTPGEEKPKKKRARKRKSVDTVEHRQPETPEAPKTISPIIELTTKELDKIEKAQKPKRVPPSIESLEKRVDNLSQQLIKVSQSHSSGGGAGALKDLDDVDTSSQQNSFALKFNSSTGKYDFGDVEVDLSAVDQDIIPDQNNLRNLGSSSKRFNDLFLSGDTIDLAGATISSDGTGTIAISGTGATLPAGSKAGDNQLAVVSTGSAGAAGQVSRVIPFFSAAGGLSTKNTDFEFNAIIDEKFVFTGTKTFTLANGSALADSDPTLFQF
jgi:hypothetical protein